MAAGVFLSFFLLLFFLTGEFFAYSLASRNNRKRGAASLRSRLCVKRNAVFGARFKGLSLYFLYQKGNLIRIKTGLATCPIRIQTRTPLVTVPPL